MREISGREISLEIIGELKKLPVPQKSLVAFLIGEDPASESFLKRKQIVAEDLGLDFQIEKLNPDLGQAEIEEKISISVSGDSVGGVIIQLPIPESLDKDRILRLIPAEKDIDLLSSEAKELFRAGESKALPPSVAVLEEIISREKLDLPSINVAIVGLGELVGEPISIWFSQKSRELYKIDEGDSYLPIKECDLVITGAGKAGLIKKDHLKKGAIVIDYGYSINNGRLKGDLSEEAYEKLSAYTPTPGGTGPILVAKLFENFYKLNDSSNE
ncbi:MAG: hypothetical protein COT88_02310 [Candidatus Colwellbacteria bacterium CG10_big_fil_rev_8_21_14_0_10_41_28]|uniref:Methenyltetrahydrofolate cyclohydrolase n=1 Tax=Candidatus Colwellbacteria bacterium CG10_big_fil_rev_8_21_14_0_10_41_28 TaxID=1974539 RepID=A0A2H0VGT2_9BACT|nr:MAG: hypothetical protein COT88_02310 [Candidatus Colwellbacteria bacterium CG10_big_fil_rev_8_21_14_0_10_41_28]